MRSQASTASMLSFQNLIWHHAPSITPELTVGEPADSDWLITQMIDRLRDIAPRSGADALRELRRSFPDSSLTARVTAIAQLRAIER
jgi:hypothetical protein